MKAEKRKVYLELTKESNAPLCLACRYADWCGSGTLCDGGDGYYECLHPVDKLSFLNTWEEDIEPGTDCYGFYQKIDVETLTEFARTIIENGIDKWSVNLNKGSFELDTIQLDDNGQKTKYIRYRYNVIEKQLVKI